MTARTKESLAMRMSLVHPCSVPDEQPQASSESGDARRIPGSDIEDRSVAKLEAEIAELDAFACSVSHDLRAPLRAVLGFARVLEEDHGGEMCADARSCLVKIIRGAQDMGRVIEDLLMLSRTGTQIVAISHVNPRQLVDEALANLSPERTDRVCVSVGELRHCRGNVGLLQQVWTNLLSNAVKFTRERDPAVIEIGSSETDRVVTYFVRDNGAGLDMDRARDLFLPFRRFHDARQYEGHGIGLALVRRIVRRHGGRLWAEALPGKGATFSFTVAAA